MLCKPLLFNTSRKDAWTRVSLIDGLENGLNDGLENGLNGGMEYGILCKAEGTILHYVVAYSTLSDLRKVSFNADKAATYAYVEAY